MLRHISFKNFKSWEDTGHIRLAPLTVFFGTNSSGKSSIGQLLLMLKQTAESSDRTRVLDTGDRDTIVDVGSYNTFIHHHDASRDLEFELSWTQRKAVEIHDTRDPSTSYRSNDLRFCAAVAGDESTDRIRLQRFEYALDVNGKAPSFVAGIERDAARRIYRPIFGGFTPVRARGRPWDLPAPTRFYGFPDEAVAYFQNTEFLPDLSLALERVFDSISYLGPLRVDPERVYIWGGGTPPDVGWVGDQTVFALLAGGDRSFNFRAGTKLRSLQEVVGEQLRELGLVKEFRVDPIAPNRPEHEVKVTVSGRDEVLLTDVGFGVSQVLPVIVQSFYAPPESTIVMEQPELHLHPRIQQNLADFFVKAARARENGQERKTQFIIESHSEHFLRRLQRRIAEGSLEPNEIALYFCDAPRGTSSLHQLDVDLFGSIQNWPEGFFGDQFEDVAAQIDARMRRELQT